MARSKLRAKPKAKPLAAKPLKPKPLTPKAPKAVGKVTPPPLEPTDPLDTPEIKKLAGDILQSHLAAEKETVLVRAENGGRLLEAKTKLSHGDWGRFIEEKVPFNDKTVQRAINLRHFQNSQPARFQKLLPLGVSKADILIHQPPATYDALFAGQPHVIPSSGKKLTLTVMSVGELLEVIAQPEPVDQTEALLRSSSRAGRKLIRELHTLVELKDELGALDRDELVDLYDDLLQALSHLAHAYDLEAD